MLSRKEIIDRVRRVFGGRRTALRKLIIDERDHLNKARWDRIGEQLYSATRKSVQGFKPFLDEGYEHVDDPDYNTYQLGDASAYYNILLNRGVKSGLDWDKRLCARCGGTVRRCSLFVSAVLPVYITDLWYQTYSRSPRYWAFGPIIKLRRTEARIVKLAEQVLRKAGFHPLSKELARVVVPGAVTDCRRKGGASVFDCLFSDIYGLDREHTRMSDGRPLPDFYNSQTPSWKEWYTSSGVLTKREIYRTFPSGDVVTTVLDGRDRVTEVRVFPKKGMSSQTFKVKTGTKTRERGRRA